MQQYSYDFVKLTQVHHFSDASPGAYGVVTFLPFMRENDNAICHFIFSKARLAPLETISIRTHSCSAVLAVQIDQMLQELTLPNHHAIFWTNSTAVLQMISNTNKRFSVFVANRLTRIEEHTSTDQWRYVPSKKNPTDMATCIIDAESFISNSNVWLQGPEFLLEVEDLWPQPPCLLPNLPPEFLTLKKSCNALSKTKTDFFMESKFSCFSTWYELRRNVAWLLRVKDKLLRREITSQAISVDELDHAENEIIKCMQLFKRNKSTPIQKTT